MYLAERLGPSYPGTARSPSQKKSVDPGKPPVVPTLDPPDHLLGTERWPCVLCGALGRAKTNSSMKSANPVSAGGNKTRGPERGGCGKAGGLSPLSEAGVQQISQKGKRVIDCIRELDKVWGPPCVRGQIPEWSI